MISIEPKQQKTLFYIMSAAGLALVLFLFMQFLVSAKEYSYINGGVATNNTITISGTGEVFAVPDIANISFTARGTAADMKTAQDTATTLTNNAIEKVKFLGIDAKDIKTTNYSANPNYDNRPCAYYPCPPAPTKITGYEVSQTIEVKVRDTTKAGAVLEVLGRAGVSDISGPNFSIDDETALQTQARTKAISDAREKADELARELGVHIVRIVNFSESGNGYPPIYYGKTTMAMDSVAAPAPQVPAGENKITSNVSITYEIR